MYLDQDAKCAICSIAIDIYTRQLGQRESACVDHCHTTKKIRQLLCNHCNRSLGLMQENIDNLKNMIKYLEFHNE